MAADDPSLPPLPSPVSAPEPEGLPAGEPDAGARRGAGSTTTPRKWTPPPPEELSELLPQYRIEKLIDRGGMGAVYQGVQLVLERPVAIKILPAEIANEEFIARFHREARTLARLQHPGIVTIYDLGQTSEGHLYFVMELVDGANLSQIIHCGTLDPARALELTVQICEALHYAHSMGVVHRDIKPSNILVTKDGRAKLADFGLARPMRHDHSSLTISNVEQGTPDYMAPEQREGRADQRSDIYALGVILYEMLTGKRPKGIFDPPSVKVRVDVRLDQVVIKALQQEPERRYQQISDMQTDVERIRTTSLETTRDAKQEKPKREASGTELGNQSDLPKLPRRGLRGESILFATMLKEVFLSKLRNRTNILTTVLEAPTLALLISMMLRYSDEDHYTFASAFHITTYLFLSLVVAMFLGLTNSAEEVIRDRDMLNREHSQNLRVSYYIFAKIASLATFALIQCGIYLLIGNAVMEIREMFFVHLIWMFLTSLAGVCMGLLVSTLVRDIRTALHVILLLLFPQMLLGVGLSRHEGDQGLDFVYSIRRWVDNRGTASKLKVPLIGQFMTLRWSYESAIISQAKLNPLTSTSAMLKNRIQSLIQPAGQQMTQAQSQELDRAKQALAVVSGLQDNCAADITRRLRQIQEGIESGNLDPDLLDPPKGRRNVSAEEIFVNRKVLDLVTKAEMEREDYRRTSSPNVFFGTVRTYQLLSPSATAENRTVTHQSAPKPWYQELRVDTLTLNATVMVIAIVMKAGILHVLLRHQLSKVPRSRRPGKAPLASL